MLWIYSANQFYTDGAGAIELGNVSTTQPWLNGPGKNFPDGQAQWIWVTAGANNGASTTVQPVFSTTITVSQNTQVLLNMIADDIGDVYVNGALIKTVTTSPAYWGLPYPPNSTIPLTLVVGTNVISVHVTNTGGPAGLAASVTSGDGQAVLARTSRVWTYRV